MEMVYGFPPKPNMTTFTAKNEDSILTEFFEQPSNFNVEFFFDIFKKYLYHKMDEDTDEFKPTEDEEKLFSDVEELRMDSYTILNTKPVFSKLKLIDIIKYINKKYNNHEDQYFNLFLLNKNNGMYVDLIHTPIKNKTPNATSSKVNLNTAIPITVTKATDLFNS